MTEPNLTACIKPCPPGTWCDCLGCKVPHEVDAIHEVRPYCIGSPIFPGLAKHIEESSEVAIIIAKIMGCGHMGLHWDGQNLKEELEKELGDQLATLKFLAEQNDLDYDKIFERSLVKLKIYRRWHRNVLAGRHPYDDGDNSPLYGDPLEEPTSGDPQ